MVPQCPQVRTDLHEGARLKTADEIRVWRQGVARLIRSTHQASRDREGLPRGNPQCLMQIAREHQIFQQSDGNASFHALATCRKGTAAQPEEKIVERLLVELKNCRCRGGCDRSQKNL